MTTSRYANYPPKRIAQGHWLCRFCGKRCPGRRTSYCSAKCEEEVAIRCFAGVAVRKVLERAGRKCEICGKADDHEWSRRSSLEIHHILPVKDGGGGCGLDNLIALCHECHLAAHEKLRREVPAKYTEKAEGNWGELPLFDSGGAVAPERKGV